MEKHTLCAVPWMHLNFEPNGKVLPCCLTSTYNYFAGDLTTHTIEEIWNSDNMKKMRTEMNSRAEPDICRKCFDRERVTGESGRIYHNREFAKVIDIIPEITQPDGTVPDMKLKYWDFRFSNLCNFKCRSCGPRYSSSWVPDAKKLNWISEQDKVWNIEAVDDKTNFDFLKDQVQHVQKIYFAGGEPLLMDEHWQILEMLVEHKRFDVKISYNTNASTLTYQGKNVLDYWRLWEKGKIEVWPSLDEIGSRAELIRSGTVWSKVENNVQQMVALENITVRPGLTIGAMNVFRLPEIVTHLTNIGVIGSGHFRRNFFINLLEDPKHYHVHILPDDFRAEIVEKIETFIDDYNQEYKSKIGPAFTHILHELKKPWSERSTKRFLQITQQLDELRGEDTFKTIPELQKVKDHYEQFLQN
jgi:radical SAM protein with 4Fe4S-binding SPASM domain